MWGRYCGAGCGDPTNSIIPIDSVDSCCQIHDQCFDAHFAARDAYDGEDVGFGTFCDCDLELIACLKEQVPQDEAISAVGNIIRRVFEIRYRRTHCDQHDAKELLELEVLAQKARASL